MATAVETSGGSVLGMEKRPPFSVEYYNDQIRELDDQEREHRRHQFKALTGFESYSEFVRDFYRRPAHFWSLLHRGPHLPPSTILAPFLSREISASQPQQSHHTKLTPIDEFAIPFRKLATLETNAQLAADYDMSPGHFDALMLNVATLLAVFWAPDYYLWSDYLQQRNSDAAKHALHLQHHFREGLDETLFDYLKHAMIRKRRSHEAPPQVADSAVFHQAQEIAMLDIAKPSAAVTSGSAGAAGQAM